MSHDFCKRPIDHQKGKTTGFFKEKAIDWRIENHSTFERNATRVSNETQLEFCVKNHTIFDRKALDLRKENDSGF